MHSRFSNNALYLCFILLFLSFSHSAYKSRVFVNITTAHFMFYDEYVGYVLRILQKYIGSMFTNIVELVFIFYLFKLMSLIINYFFPGLQRRLTTQLIFSPILVL